MWNRVRNTDILERARMVPLEEQIRQIRLQWFGHVWRMPTSHSKRQLLRCRPSGRGRLTGGAPLHRCDLINRDLRDINNWTWTITNRQQWTAQIFQSMYPCTSATAAGSCPASPMGHGEQRRCACMCVHMYMHPITPEHKRSRGDSSGFVTCRES